MCHSRAILSSLILLVFVCLGCGKKDAKGAASQPSTTSEHAKPLSVIPQPPPAPPQQAAPQAATVSELTGEVTKGHGFEMAVAGGLIFRLEPDAGDDSGWEIRLAPGADAASASMDCIGAVSVPLHGDETLSIQPPGVDKDRDESQWKKREFDFVPESSDCKKAWDLANEAHYPSNLTDLQREEAEVNLGKIPTSQGVFQITDFRPCKSKGKDAPAQIEWLKFTVHLEFPPAATRQSSATKALDQPTLVKTSGGPSVDEQFAHQSIRNTDFDKPMTALLAKQLGGRGAMKAACKDSLRKDPVEIESTVFGDVDGDGNEEAAVSAFSCQAGQAGPDLFAVFKLSAKGELVEMSFELRKWNQPFKERDPSVGLRGAPTIAIEHGRLAKLYGIFTDKDGGCCPTGGTRKFLYRWDGHQFVLDDIIDVPPEHAGK